MIFVIEKARSIKEMVARLDVCLYELQSNKRVLYGEYSIAVDLQPYVSADQTDQGTRLNMNGDGLMQEITNSIGAMQLTSIVTKNLEGVEWQVLSEEEKKQLEDTSSDGYVEALQNEMTTLADNLGTQ
jgi:hypothetical protein